MDKDGKETPRIRYLTRREMLGLMGSTAVAVTLVGCGGEQSGSSGSANPETTGAFAEAPSTCLVKPEQTEGPYYVDVGLDRSDIREDREGVPMDLTFNVSRVDQNDPASCGPLADAIVDIWHCDALGEYSGVQDNAAGDFDTRGETFLRGYQVTDQNGAARFTTIYPGWYRGRAVHIHFTIRDSPESEQGYEFTSQLYFDDALTDEVFSEGPYAEKGGARPEERRRRHLPGRWRRDVARAHPKRGGLRRDVRYRARHYLRIDKGDNRWLLDALPLASSWGSGSCCSPWPRRGSTCTWGSASATRCSS